jgi:hypothetical protein
MLGARLAGQMASVSDDELRAYYKNIDRRLGLGADLTSAPEVRLRA